MVGMLRLLAYVELIFFLYRFSIVFPEVYCVFVFVVDEALQMHFRTIKIHDAVEIKITDKMVA